MYLSLLQIKNFRCFDGNEHSITFKKGLNVLVGENDSGKSAIMDAIKLVLGTTDMNWYRVEQEDFYNTYNTFQYPAFFEPTRSIYPFSLKNDILFSTAVSLTPNIL